MVLTGGDDQTVCLWKWRSDEGELFLFHKVCLDGFGSIRSLLVVAHYLVGTTLPIIIILENLI